MKTENGQSRLMMILFCAVFFILTTCSFLFVVKDEIISCKDEPIVYTKYDMSEDEKEALCWLSKGDVLEVEVAPGMDHLSGVSLAFDLRRLEEENEKAFFTVTFTQAGSEDVLAFWDLSSEDVYTQKFSDFDFPDGEMKVEKGETYRITLTITEGENVGLYLSDTSSTLPTYVNGEEIDGTIAFRLFGGRTANIAWYAVVLFVCWILFFAAFVLCFFLHVKPERAAASLIFFAGILYILVIPPFTTPDEVAHFNTAYLHSSEVLHTKTKDADGKTIMRTTDYAFFQSFQKVADDKDLQHSDLYEIFEEQVAQDADSTILEENEIGKALGSSGLAYLPQVCALVLGRLLGVNGMTLFCMGRFFMLIAFAAAVYFAVKWMPFAKLLPAAIGMFPLVMQQMVSYNYDAVLFAASFLLVSYLLRLIYEKEKVTWKDFLLVFLFLFFIAVSKPVYLCILLMGILIPKEKFERKGQKNGTLLKWGFAGGLIILSFLSYYVFRSAVASSVLSDSNTLDWTDEPGYSPSLMMQYPLHTIGVLLRSLLQTTSELFGGAIGDKMGILSFGVSFLPLAGILITAVVTAQRKAGEECRVRTRDKGVFFIVMVLTWIAAEMSMLLGWTTENSLVVQGMQGRYFVPILVLFFLLLRNHSVSIRAGFERNVYAALAVFETYAVWELFRGAFQR